MAVRTERSGPVTTVVMSRPERRNAVDRTQAQGLSEAFQAFDADPEQAVAVLWGEGGTFCAGADLKGIASEGGKSAPRPEGGNGPLGCSHMQLSKPVIAAVAGHAVAGGLELALWCDLRVAEEGAVFGVFCRRFGVPLVDGGTVRLPRIVGMGRALDMILTGRPVAAEEALRFGLADRVVPDGTSREAAEALAAEIARFPQLCVQVDRRSAYAGWDAPVAEALAAELREGWAVVESGETLEGARRFASGIGRHGEFE